MKCEDCGAELVNVAGAYLCPICDDDFFEEPDDLNKTMDDEAWSQGGADGR